jgi:hypothetical protein
MKVAIVRGGGVAGLTSRTRLAAEALPSGDAKALAERVRKSRLQTMPEPPPQPARHADQLLYAISVDDGGCERTLRFTDESLPEEVRSLVEWVDAHPKSEREVLPPG